MSTGSLAHQQPSPWTQASEEYACDHRGSTILTVFTASNNVSHVVRQCTRCGSNLGAVRKADVPPGTRPPAFDPSIQARWLDAIRARASELRARAAETREQERAEFSSWYRDEYLHSPEWHRKRDKVLARADGRCEGCGERRATQVHHLTYTHVGREFLFQLVAVCRDCHEQIHASQEQPG
jgi:ribosomal protein S14